jgi:threonine/homoserine/homoserine lactone efflux protein
MGQALGTVLPLAVAVAIFPVPVIAVVLLVGSERGRAKGLAFVLAWAAGLGVVGALVLAFADAFDKDAGSDATWPNVILLVLGLLALAASVKQWLGRPRGGAEAAPPGWMRMIDSFTVAKAAGAGIALTALNPKNLLLTVAAAAEIVEADLSAGQEVAVLVVFVAIASVGVLTPLVLSVALGARSHELLDGLRGWMAGHNAAIMAVLLLVIGAKLIGDAVSGFSS